MKNENRTTRPGIQCIPLSGGTFVMFIVRIVCLA